MEISLISLFSSLGGFTGIAILVIQLGKLLGWWASAPVDGKVTNPEDQFPIAAAVLRALADGTVTSDEAAQIMVLLAKLKSSKE